MTEPTTDAPAADASGADSSGAVSSGADAIDFVAQTLALAIREGASDIHFDPCSTGGRVRFRIDGFFREGRTLAAADYERCLGRLKLIGGVVVYRQNVPQEGRIDRSDGAADLRLSVIPTPYGEKAVVRVFETGRPGLTLAELGFTPAISSELKRLAGRRQGMLLATGPCSSGKTTSLYALVREILRARGSHAHVVSLEDPVEQRLEGVTQLEVDEDRGITFAAGLKTLLRQDPEVILVGEIRDAVTARIACEAAFTGHLVLSSMHVGDPAEVVLRLLQMGVEPYVLASSLGALLNQRLLRGVCSVCVTDQSEAKEDCSSCGGCGYRGRFPIGEIVELDDALRELVLQRADRRRLAAALASSGSGLRADAERALAAGRTSEQEIERVLGVEVGDAS